MKPTTNIAPLPPKAWFYHTTMYKEIAILFLLLSFTALLKNSLLFSTEMEPTVILITLSITFFFMGFLELMLKIILTTKQNFLLISFIIGALILMLVKLSWFSFGYFVLIALSTIFIASFHENEADDDGCMYQFFRMLAASVFLGVQYSTTKFIVILSIYAPVIFVVLFAIIVYSIKNLFFAEEQKKLRKLSTDGVIFNCTSCLHTIQPNHVFCPSCNQKHQVPLLPSEYGLFYHHCGNCDSPLPTQVEERRPKNISLYCPHCNEGVANDFVIPQYFIFVEKQGTTNSSLTPHLLKTLEDQFQNKAVNEYPFCQITYHIYSQQYPYRLQFYAKGNTNIDKRKTILKKAVLFYKNTNNIMFILSSLKEENEKPLTMLRSLLHTLEKYRTAQDIRAIKFNLILKIEAQRSNEFFFKKDASIQHSTILEDFITENLREEAFIHHVKQQFDTINYYALNNLESKTTKVIMNIILN